MDYNKVIFVCNENTCLSPMAEWIFKSILMDKSKEIISRGIVVLFPEPRIQKVTDLLVNHSIPCEEQTSREFDIDEVDKDTLIICINFMDKVKVIEDFGIESNLFTLKEYVEIEENPIDPYGGDDEAYEECYAEIKELLYLFKKKLGWE